MLWNFLPLVGTSSVKLSKQRASFRSEKSRFGRSATILPIGKNPDFADRVRGSPPIGIFWRPKAFYPKKFRIRCPPMGIFGNFLQKCWEFPNFWEVFGLGNWRLQQAKISQSSKCANVPNHFCTVWRTQIWKFEIFALVWAKNPCEKCKASAGTKIGGQPFGFHPILTTSQGWDVKFFANWEVWNFPIGGLPLNLLN